MKRDISVKHLLEWRLAQAEADAPPTPRADHLLTLARPWWETWPERFRSVTLRLGKMQVEHGHARATPQQSRCGHSVPVMIVQEIEEVEAFARVLYLKVQGGRLRLRFEMERVQAHLEETYEATFVSDSSSRPLLAGWACRAAGSDYWLDAELAEAIAKSWTNLKVTDRMPFCLILHAQAEGR